MIAIISDLHLGEPTGRFALPRRLAGRHDTTHFERSMKLVDEVNRLDVDAVVILGDGTDRTMPKELEELVRVIMAIRHKVIFVPGNHDVTDRWRQGVGYSPKGHRMLRSALERCGLPVKYPHAVDFDAYRVLCLDSSAHGEKGTLFARGRIGKPLGWLKRELADQRPTVVAMHHYPERVNPTLAVEDAEQLMRVCARDHVTIINGHRHREGQYPRSRKRPRILTHGKCVEDGRIRILDPVSGEFWWSEVTL